MWFDVHYAYITELTDWNWNKLVSVWWLMLSSNPCFISWLIMLGCASGAHGPLGGLTHEHTTLAALCYSQTAQCTAMTKQGSCAFPHIPPACSINADRLPATQHCQVSLTDTIPPKTHPHPAPTSYADGRPCSAAVHMPWPLTIKKSSPLSGPSWPCYTKCYCQGQLVQGQLRSYCTVLYTQRALWKES